MNFHDLTALDIAKKISKKEVTCVEVTSFFISRIQKVNPTLNALVEDRFSEAIIEAKNLDHELQHTTLSSEELLKSRPFLGVPVTIKEMIAVQHMKSTQGSLHRKSWVSPEEATIVERIKQAGAIVLGTSNVPEVGFWFECFNKVYGTTNNPWDITRTCGGSTGGEAALIGSGASPMGLGSDIGGSIRIPAAFCGIFGHKPSEKIIPITGHFPIYKNNAKEFVPPKYPFTVLGPLAKSPKDLVEMMKVMIGPDGFDPCVTANSFDLNLEPVDNTWTVYVLPAPKIFAVSETSMDVRQTVEKAAQLFKDSGAKIKKLDPKIFFKVFDMWTAKSWSVEGRDFTSTLTRQQGINFFVETIKMLFKKGTYTAPAYLTAFTEKFFADRSQKDFFQQELNELKSKMDVLLTDKTILLMPVYPSIAPKHLSTLKTPFDFCYAAVANALGYPATAVPMGFSSQEHLPLAVQIMGGDKKDKFTLSAAQYLYENTSKIPTAQL